VSQAEPVVSGPVLRLRFFFDAGSGTCLWAKGDAARERFGYAVALDDLPVSQNVRRALIHLCAWYDTSLDWDDPAGASPWSAEERGRFDTRATSVLAQLREALGPAFDVIDESRGSPS
jgi:hypothetical protein